MKRRRPYALLTACFGVLAVAGCAGRRPAPAASTATPAPEALTPAYAAAAASGERVYRLDRSASRVLVLVGKTGPLAGAGHDHVIVVGDLAGFARLGPRGGRANLEFPVRSLIVDPPDARSALGGAYAEPLDAGSRSGTREHMLSKSSLDAADYPRVALAIASPAPRTGSTPFKVSLTLHGTTREFTTRGHASQADDSLLADGTFYFLQSDYGIQPYSVLFGALRIKDRLEIRYHLAFERWNPNGS